MFKKVRLSLLILLSLTCAGYLTSTIDAEARSKKTKHSATQTESSEETSSTAKSEDKNRFAAYCSKQFITSLNCKDLCSEEGNQIPNCLKGCRQGIAVVTKFCESLDTEDTQTRSAMSKSCSAEMKTPCGTPCQMRKTASAEAAKQGYAKVMNNTTADLCGKLKSGSAINTWARENGIKVPS